MDSNLITALATTLLVIVGLAQIIVLITQHRQNQLNLLEIYRRRWNNLYHDWATVIFIGKENNAYYQVADTGYLKELKINRSKICLHTPTIWALKSSHLIFSFLSDTCIKILQGQLDIKDFYPLLSTEFLRHSRALRILLDNSYPSYCEPNSDKNHILLQREIQEWLIYHDGIRRRCLMLIDLLWAEAVRIEDLPPQDIKKAANAKIKSGILSRRRVWSEVFLLNGLFGIYFAVKYYCFLYHSEYRSFWNRNGISRKRLKQLDAQWTKRLLEL